ncbi:phospholipid carrier-dependent glycosyltransferase, partial [Micrococcus luteus]
MPATALAPRPAAVAVDDGPFGVAALRARLGVSAAPLTRWHWILPLLVTVIAGVLRFTNLAHPD